jgi:hypothetical protein
LAGCCRDRAVRAGFDAGTGTAAIQVDGGGGAEAIGIGNGGAIGLQGATGCDLDRFTTGKGADLKLGVERRCDDIRLRITFTT